MTPYREPSARRGAPLAVICTLAAAMALAGCWGDDDNNDAPPAPVPPASAPSTGSALTAAQITAAQAALDAQSAPPDVGATGNTDIATGQIVLDDQAGLTKEAGK